MPTLALLFLVVILLISSTSLLAMSAVKELLQVKRLSEFAILPSRGSIYAAGLIFSDPTSFCPSYSVVIHLLVDVLGYDLSSAYDTIVPKRGKAIVKTDLAVAIPWGTYARIGKQPSSSSILSMMKRDDPVFSIIAPRSGLAVKNFIDVGAGVVDYDYRGNVGVVLFNHR